MAAIHELYGIQAEQLESLRIEYGNLLSLLLRIKLGEVDISDVEIQGNGWKINQHELADEAIV